MQVPPTISGPLGLPQTEGWLPVWLLFTCLFSTYNAIQNYVTLNVTRRIYSKQPQWVNPLTARLFATWTMAGLLIRGTAAYNINDRNVYNLAMASWLLGFVHFAPEILIFRTADFAFPPLSPMIVAGTSLVWMARQYDFYVQ